MKGGADRSDGALEHLGHGGLEARGRGDGRILWDSDQQGEFRSSANPRCQTCVFEGPKSDRRIFCSVELWRRPQQCTITTRNPDRTRSVFYRSVGWLPTGIRFVPLTLTLTFSGSGFSCKYKGGNDDSGNANLSGEKLSQCR